MTPIICGISVLLLGVQVSGDGLGSSGHVTPASGALGLSKEPLRKLDRSCALCHTVDASFSHPTGITPTMAVPADLPLVDNTIRCVTCHEGESGRKHANAPASYRILLREEPGDTSLCVKCHEPFGLNRIDAHATSISIAHPRGVTVRDYEGSDHQRRLRYEDSGTQNRCRACHDGSIVSETSHTRSNMFAVTPFRLGEGGHPVGIEYRMSNPDDADGDLRRPSELDSRIRLFENKVTCQSCHSLYSIQPSHLVMPNDRSALCLGCHLY